jgi:arsenate reductase
LRDAEREHDRKLAFHGVTAILIVASLSASRILRLLPAFESAATRASTPAGVARKESTDMSVTIYHNPSCGTSRNTLAMIRQSGTEPEIIEYLKTPPSRERLIQLIKEIGLTVRELLREKGTPYAELGLADPKWSDDQLLDFMLAHPILINRPIVVTDKGTRICRPSEAVLDLLENPPESFVKEDGEVVTRKKP